MTNVNLPEHFELKNSDPERSAGGNAELVTFIQQSPIDPLAAKIAWKRGIRDQVALNSFLNPLLAGMTSPQLIEDMDLAVERIYRAIEGNEPLMVFSDYDVDGTTGGALLRRFFRDIGVDTQSRQPDRFHEGYGLNLNAVQEALAAGVRVLITVDCGITSFAPIEAARDAGIDVIIVDHHQVDPVRGMPPALAILNPQKSTDTSGLKYLCGCGLAFYFATAIRKKLRDSGYFQRTSVVEPILRDYLDDVVLATAADMVPLVADNRALVFHGLQVLRKTNRPGLRSMIELAGLKLDSISPGSLGFQLGPRINASGRLSHAGLALECLTTTDESRGRELARHIEDLNQERMRIQNQIWDEIRSSLLTESGPESGLDRFPHGIVVADSSWHEGVVGIVASRIVDFFKKPACVLFIREDGTAKGSVRSARGLNVLDALRSCEDFLLTYGGHHYAAGLSLKQENLDAFCVRWNEALGVQSQHLPLQKKTIIDLVVQFSELSLRAFRDIERLAPFGPGNPEPHLALLAVPSSPQLIKSRHLKFTLSDPADSFKKMDAIYFNGTDDDQIFTGIERAAKEGRALWWVGAADINRFLGQQKSTFRIKSVCI